MKKSKEKLILDLPNSQKIFFIQDSGGKWCRHWDRDFNNWQRRATKNVNTRTCLGHSHGMQSTSKQRKMLEHTAVNNIKRLQCERGPSWNNQLFVRIHRPGSHSQRTLIIGCAFHKQKIISVLWVFSVCRLPVLWLGTDEYSVSTCSVSTCLWRMSSAADTAEYSAHNSVLELYRPADTRSRGLLQGGVAEGQAESNKNCSLHQGSSGICFLSVTPSLSLLFLSLLSLSFSLRVCRLKIKLSSAMGGWVPRVWASRTVLLFFPRNFEAGIVMIGVPQWLAILTDLVTSRMVLWRSLRFLVSLFPTVCLSKFGLLLSLWFGPSTDLHPAASTSLNQSWISC